MNTPKIRFKEFEGEWKKSTIGDVAPLQRGFDLPTHSIVQGSVPVVYSNGILRFHNESRCIAPAIVTGRSGTIGKFTFIESGGYWPHNTSLWVTSFYKNIPRFVYYMFQNVGFEKYATGSGVPTLNRNDVHKHVISIPLDANEQQQIASYFTHLDSLISASTSRLASLKQVKEASLQAMFPQEGETVPKIRFKGFEGKWKKVKLGDLFSERTENDINGEMLSVTMHDGIIKASENGRFDNSNSDKSNYKLVLENDIAYNSMRMWQGASGCSPYRGIVSPAYTVITPYEDVNSSFFACFFKTSQMIEKFRLHSQGLTKDTWNLKFPAFSKITVTYPQSVAEQRAIASYFTSLDRRITLETQRLEKLKQIKAACLDKMFV